MVEERSEMRRRAAIPLLSTLMAVLLMTAGELDAQSLLITELCAASGCTLLDEDGDGPDWFEVHNRDTEDVDLDGYFATDDAGDPTRWRFSGAILPAGGYLVVFASGKNRRDPDGELHTSFRLDGDGEFLALVAPDGVTALSSYAPAFPAQRPGFSYGLASHVEELVAVDSPLEVLVPLDGGLGTAWTEAAFEPGPAWRTGPGGVGFVGDEAGPPPEDLVSYFSFDGTLNDDFGSNDGVFRGGVPTYVSGHDGAPGSALFFDGVDDLVVVAQNESLPLYGHAAFSVSMWVRGPRQADRRVFSEGSSSNNSPVFNIGVEASGARGTVDLYIRDSGGGTLHPHTNSVTEAFDDTWHHILWSDDSGDARLYVDGVLDATDFRYARRNIAFNRTSIGAILRAGPSYFFRGVIDEVSLWSRALTGEEARELASGSLPVSLSGSGYESRIGVDIENEMAGRGASVYVRLPFVVDDPESAPLLDLSIAYDDGFVAWINGVEVARRNAPEDISWRAAATVDRDRAEAIVPELVPLGDLSAILGAGVNVLAVQGLNSSVDDPELLIQATLVGTDSSLSRARYFSAPTPGAPNGDGIADFVADTVFGVDRGFFQEAFDVEITCATEGAVVRYTTDASEPTAEHGEVYSGPVRVDTTTTLRAAAFRAGFEPSNIDTQTYIFPQDVLRQQRPAGYPTSWSGTPADYDMDIDVVDDPDHAPQMEAALLGLPSISVVLEHDDLFGASGIYMNPQRSGRGWERRASAELLYPDGRAGFQIDAGVRITGNRSRGPGNSPKHGLRLIFRSEYGDAKLRFPLFVDSEVERFDTITIKPNAFDSWVSDNSGQRQGALYFRDQWVRDAQRDTGHPTSHGFFVHLYINGLYWGVYNLGERPDASFAAEHFGGDKESWDAVKNHEELVDGSLDAYRQLDRLRQGDLSVDANYQAILGYLDVTNMADYMIANMFAPATDWPGNYYMIRERRPGAGFKFVSWDAEYAFLGGVGLNRTVPHRRDADSPTKFYHACRANEEFRVLFGDRVHRHFFHGGELTAGAADERTVARADEIGLALLAESSRWGDYRRGAPYRPDVEWEAELDSLRNDYLPQRTAIVLEQFRQLGLYPRIDAPRFNQHGGDVPAGFALDISGTEGSIYYTTDGNDPRSEGGGLGDSAQVFGLRKLDVLLPPDAPARAFIPTDDSLGLSWTQPGFDDSGWRTGTSGVGYERTTGFEHLIGLDVGSDMDGRNGSAYIRVPFDVERPADVRGLSLRMQYDDGFVAYLNGVEVHRSNAPDPVTWSAVATTLREDDWAVVATQFEMDERLPLLRAGRNVLAIHGLNSSPSSSDFLIRPEILGGFASGAGPEIERSTVVKARARAGASWSALNEAVFAVDPALRITEIQYHPAASPQGGSYGREEFAFVELQNVGADRIDLRGVRLVEGVRFEFTGSGVEELLPGEVVVVVENLRAFAERYDLAAILVAGEYSGQLDNDGETLRLVGGLGETIQEFSYDDAWHPTTDGSGPSLVIDDPSLPRASWSLGESWRPSELPFGTPGFDEAAIAGGGLQRPGDLNQDARLDLSDAVALLRHLFLGIPATLPCGDGTSADPANTLLLDANGDADVNLSDGIHLLAFLFQGGAPPFAGSECVRMNGCPDGCIR